MNSKELAQKLIEMVQSLTTELEAWIEKSNKQAAKRARKLTLQMEKTGKEFRKASVAEANEMKKR